MKLDEAIKAWREDPSDDNRRALLEAQAAHAAAFRRLQADEYVARVTAPDRGIMGASS